MSREIKFRAWDNVNKRMGHFDAGFSWHDEYNLWYISQVVVEHDREITDVPCGDNINIMQFTGLLDKNGKEIYEGDIMRVPLWSQQYGKNNKCKYFNMVVIWNNRHAWFEYEYPKGTGKFNVRNNGLDVNEVIGNIYEHPELLSQPATT